MRQRPVQMSEEQWQKLLAEREMTLPTITTYTSGVLAQQNADQVAADQMNLGQNPKDRLGIKKAPLHLVPPASMIYQALAMEDGAKKYGPYNWRSNKVIASIYVSACMRHLQQWLDGEENAEDSEKPHLAHAIACLGILIDAKETGNLVDDRPVKGAATDLIKRWEKK